MEVSPTDPASSSAALNPNDPLALLHVLVALQSQTLEVQKQILDHQRQQLELAREAALIAREGRARQIAELERWQAGHGDLLDRCRDSLGKLEAVHAALIAELAEYVDEHHENLLEGDFALSEFVDRFGPRLAHLNTMLAVLRPLAVGSRKSE